MHAPRSIAVVTALAGSFLWACGPLYGSGGNPNYERCGAATCDPPPISSGVPSPSVTAPAPSACPPSMAGIPGGLYVTEPGQGQKQVAPYCMDRTLVTVDAFVACVQAGVCAPPNAYDPNDYGGAVRSNACNYRHPGRGNYPINCVDQYQSATYCQWRKGARLPTLAEWQWAAMNGERATAYPWGDDPPTPARLNICGTECQDVKAMREHPDLYDKPSIEGGDSFKETSPVDAFPAGRNDWGVGDLLGNVTQWTSTWWGSLKGVPHVYVAGVPYDITTLRTVVAEHTYDSSAARVPRVGFRCVFP